MWKIINLKILFVQIIIVYYAHVVVSLRIPTVNSKNIIKTKDDFSTDYAKGILPLAKAAEIKSYLNTNIDPCNNFYSFACGNWRRSNPAQTHTKDITERLTEISKTFNLRLLNLLNEKENDNPLENKVKQFHRSCQVARTDEMGYELALENVYREYGEFPVLAGDAWDDAEFNWWEIIAKIQNKYGKQIIFAVDIMGDVKDNSQNSIYIGATDYDKSIYTEKGSAYRENTLLARLVDNFGIDRGLAMKTAKEIVKFEKELLDGFTDSNEGLGLEGLLVPSDVNELTEKYQENFNLKNFLLIVLNEVPQQNFYIYDEKYFNHTLEVIANKPKRIVANYIFLELLEEYFVENDDNMPVWCLEKTRKYFGKLIDNLVYNHYKNPRIEAEVHAVFEDIRATFRDDLRGNKLDWIANETREYAIEKLNAIQMHIKNYDDEDFTQFYGDIEMDRLNYIQNVRTILIHRTRINLRRLQTNDTSPTDDTEILSSSPSYNILENNVTIPVAFLQPRHFWDDTYPQALKYGTLGYFMSHEIIHAFDDEGRKYDKNGNLLDWWDEKSIYGFNERRKCFQAQYHAYKYGGVHLPDSISQSENIADNGGIKLAYATYQNWLRRNGANSSDELSKNETLRGLPLDNNQLFFVAFAQLLCEDVLNDYMSTALVQDDHAPSMYRVVGSLSNYQEFSWAFQCKQDAPMDPEYKCSIF